MDKRRSRYKVHNLQNTSDRNKIELEISRKNNRKGQFTRFRQFEHETSHFTINEILTDLDNVNLSMVAIQALRMWVVNETSDCVEAVLIDKGVLQKLVTILSSSDSNDLLRETLWCISVITANGSSAVANILPAIPCMIQWVASRSLDDDSLVHICCIIGNVASESDLSREYLLYHNCLSALLNLLSITIVENKLLASTCAWTLSNLARGKTPSSCYIENNSLPSLIKLISSNIASIAVEIHWLFAFLTAKDDETITQLIKYGLIEEVLVTANNYMGQIPDMDLLPLFRILRNLTFGWIDELITSSIHCNRSQLFQNILIHYTSIANTSRLVIMEVLQIIDNLFEHDRVEYHSYVYYCETTPSTSNQQYVFNISNNDNNTTVTDSSKKIIFDHLLQVLLCDDYDLQRDVIYTICRILERSCCSDIDIISYYLLPQFENKQQSLRYKFLDQIVKLLKIIDSDMNYGCLFIMKHIMQYKDITHYSDAIQYCITNNVAEIIENIQYSKVDQEICQMAEDIVEVIFKIMEEDESYN